MTESKHSKILIAYFSRTGEQYSVGNITEGNTKGNSGWGMEWDD